MRLTFALVLLTAASLSSASADELADHVGQVLIKNDDCLIVKGDRWAGWVRFKETPACEEGDIVRVTGKSFPYKWTTMEILELRNLNVLGSRPLPAARDVSGHEIFDGRMLFEFVRIKGVFVSVSPGEHGWSWVIVRTATGDVGVTIRESYHTCEELRSLLDAEVSIRGIVVYSWGSEQKLGAHVSLRGDKALEVLSQSQAPFQAPSFTSTAVAHRQTLTGTILARGEGRLVIQSPAHGIVQVVPSPNAMLPAVGHRITFAGFAETDPVNIRFRESLCRDEGPDRIEAVAPVVPTPSKLKDGHLHGKTVVLEGLVLGLGNATAASSVFSIDCAGCTVLVDASALQIPSSALPEVGSTVRVVGIMLSEYENASTTEIFPRLRRLVVLPRDKDDLVTLKTPPWWTPRKFVLCLFVLLVLYALRELTVRSLTRIKLRERTQLAVDIHDTLAQHLTGVSLQLDAVELAEKANRPDLAKTHLDYSRNALRSCRENLRYCIGDLRGNLPDASDMSEFIREIVRPHIGTAKLAVRFNVARRTLSDKEAYAIGRVIRELAVNAVRHGKASRILIAGERKDGRIRFSVKDNGCGFDPNACPGAQQGHFGLVGIRERLKTLKGELRILSQPNHGAKAIVTICRLP